ALCLSFQALRLFYEFRQPFQELSPLPIHAAKKIDCPATWLHGTAQYSPQQLQPVLHSKQGETGTVLASSIAAAHIA
ncbi:hypothetical protein, partial [Pseudomonas sp.]|uniref:hypothetical protein n=1 Tax=Pseudomonas sp. TaxID=306 RepID=UPI0025801682